MIVALVFLARLLIKHPISRYDVLAVIVIFLSTVLIFNWSFYSAEKAAYVEFLELSLGFCDKDKVEERVEEYNKTVDSLPSNLTKRILFGIILPRRYNLPHLKVRYVNEIPFVVKEVRK